MTDAMPGSSSATPRPDDSGVADERVRLPGYIVAGIAGPIGAWIVHHEVSYGTATLWCSAPVLLLHLLTVVLFAFVAFTTWRVWRRTDHTTAVDEGQRHGGPSLSRFVSWLAMLNGLLFGTAIIAQGIPNVFMHPCS